MEEIIIKIIERLKTSSIIRYTFRDKINFGLYNYIFEYSKEPVYNDINISWLIDIYILMFSQNMDLKELEKIQDFLNTRDESTLIIGLNMLYNIKLKIN